MATKLMCILPDNLVWPIQPGPKFGDEVTGLRISRGLASTGRIIDAWILAEYEEHIGFNVEFFIELENGPDEVELARERDAVPVLDYAAL